MRRPTCATPCGPRPRLPGPTARAVGLIPTRYERTVDGTDEALLLGRRTEWVADDDGGSHGLGQRMLATDAGEHPLMDVRAIVFGTQVPDLSAAEGAAHG
jgi:type VI secretion system protein ImpE